jgi:uncharacterized protein (TIGR00159 family)
MFPFDFNILDIIDIVLVAILLFQLYKLVRGTVAINIFVGIISIYIMWKIFSAFGMELVSEIFDQFMSVGVLALIIVFQQEIRRFLILIGKTSFKNQKFFIKSKKNIKILSDKKINEISDACENMSKSKTGAILVIEKNNTLDLTINTGRIINSELSKIMIENIFFKNSPLHDGAIVIQNEKIIAARCVLPISESKTLPVTMGMRHKSALGITEQTDCICITVSEQNGSISFYENGEIKPNINIEQLKKYIYNSI